ncbi:MAG TPA: acyl-CoA dehydrogenase family protein [Bryobacteraceae bacterium]|nr:acyl-CoA dehydrogenase family protein [Bryobacteraceae bacterium]
MASIASTAQHLGGGFVIEETAPEQVFTPEDFTDEHRAIARTTEEFWNKEVVPNLEAIQHQEPGVAVGILKKAGELGLLAAAIPEQYGGMEMDLTSALVIAEQMGRDGSYAAWHGAHTGIGMLPILLFGTPEQKATYLPRLSSGEVIGAYCLTEPHAGSDALAARTRADLSGDGSTYTLNGQKMWITNASAAGLFTVFAKVGGEQFTAFLVERGYPGVTIGAEEKKMGIKGSSTCAVYLDNVPVPAQNVLGEIGRGHIIAFNILNLGRLKLGPFAVGGAKAVIGASAKYAKERQAFGKPIAEFGMIRHKLAEMTVRTYAAESMVYRVAGLIEGRLQGATWQQPDAAQVHLKAVEEYATECSFIKVFASEALDYVVDEGVQIHGGYGYHQDYAVERAYRDSRINRIFEGTNEINRLLATGMMLKRAQRGQLPLVEAVKKLQAEILSGPQPADGDAGMRMLSNAKKVGLLVLGAAYQRFLNAIEEQQEVVAGATDILMQAFAMESALLRARKHPSEQKQDICAVFLRDSLEAVESAARNVLAACAEGDTLRTQLAVLKRFTKFDAVDAIATRRRIASRVLAAQRYTA